MPRIPRGHLPGLAYHVLNRGNGRATIFHKAADYKAFEKLFEKLGSESLLGQKQQQGTTKKYSDPNHSQ
jgi:hypothetical protein